MSRRKNGDFQRTADLSPFGRILERLVRAVPGCHGAAFVDREGEAVDIAGYGKEWDIKIVGAHARILLQDAEAIPAGAVKTLVISADRASYFIHSLPEGYALALVLGRRAAFEVSDRAITACARDLSEEAGFPMERSAGRWFPVDVLPRGPRGARPRRARRDEEGEWHLVEVLGSQVGLRRGEKAYRVRLGNGAEVTLLREPLGRWWSDERLA